MKKNKSPDSLLFVINPVSGSTDKDLLMDEIRDFCNENEITFQIYLTLGEDDLENLKSIHLKFSPDALIAVGGDGTVNLAGQVVNNTETPLGIIPLGTANGLAGELSIPSNIYDAFETILDFNLKTIDTLQINNYCCFHLSDVGFNARVVKLFSQRKERGMLSFGMIGLREYFSYSATPYEIITSEHHIKEKAFMIIITNTSGFGNILTVNPNSKLDDGKFEIAILKEFPKTQLIEVFYRLLNNTFHLSDYCTLLSTNEATIINHNGRAFHIDGETLTPEKTVKIKTNPLSLKVIIPEEIS